MTSLNIIPIKGNPATNMRTSPTIKHQHNRCALAQLSVFVLCWICDMDFLIVRHCLHYSLSLLRHWKYNTTPVCCKHSLTHACELAEGEICRLYKMIFIVVVWMCFSFACTYTDTSSGVFAYHDCGSHIHVNGLAFVGFSFPLSVLGRSVSATSRGDI